MSTSKFDAIVVGGGIVGCTAAYFLARKGLKVAVVERESLACGTSSKSFAWINGTSKTANESYHRLNAKGLAGYCDLAVEFGEQALGLHPAGSLQIVRTSDATNLATSREKLRQLEALGYPATWVDNNALRTMEPHLSLTDDAEGLYAVSDMNLNAPHFVRFMAEQVRALGGAVMEGCAAQALEAREDGQITGLNTDGGVLKSETVLLAVGPSTPEVLSGLTGFDGFAARFPMRRVPGLLVRTPDTAPHKFVRRVVYFADGPELHVLPDFNGGVRIGADDTDGMTDTDSPVEELRRVACILLERAKERLPGFVGAACIDECTLTVGLRPYPDDGHSLAGPLPGAEGLFIIATHSGVTLAPALGHLMAARITTGQTPDMLKPFLLDRVKGLG